MFYSNDDLSPEEYITLDEGLVFSLVFNFIPVEGDACTSPFREDNNPDCEFRRYKGTLQFSDYADKDFVALDCYDAVRRAYPEAKNMVFRDLINFITIKLSEKGHTKIERKKRIDTQTAKFDFLFYPTKFNLKDKEYWSQYEITKENLISDHVFKAGLIKFLNTKKGDFIQKPEYAYVYTEFIKNRKKIYLPFNKRRFSTTCKNNDIGGYSFLPKEKQNTFLMITKSYKDYRVLKNLGYFVVWFQNEGMFPDNWILLDMFQLFKSFVVFYDNDRAGIEASMELKSILEKIEIPSKHIWLPEKLLEKGVKDPADVVKEYSSEKLKNYLEHKLKDYDK